MRPKGGVDEMLVVLVLVVVVLVDGCRVLDVVVEVEVGGVVSAGSETTVRGASTRLVLFLLYDFDNRLALW